MLIKNILKSGKNYKTIVDLIGRSSTVAIYKEGDVCPNFKYSLVSKHILSDKKSVIIETSGIYQYPFNVKYNREKFSCDHTELKVFSKFINGVYGKIDYSIDLDLKIKDDNDKEILCTYLDRIASPDGLLSVDEDELKEYGNINMKLGLTQKEIFEDIHNGHIEPGVFYNMTCRFTSYNILEKITNKYEMGPVLIRNNFKKTKRLFNTKRIKEEPEKSGKKWVPFIPEILQSIGEAEKHRKPYMPDYMKALHIEGLEKQISKNRAEMKALQKNTGTRRNIRNAAIEMYKIKIKNAERRLKALQHSNNFNTTRRWKRRENNRKWELNNS